MTRFPDRWTPPPARRRLGVFTVAEAIAAGMTERQVRYRLSTGRWVHPAGRALVRTSDLRPSGTTEGTVQRCWAAHLTWPTGVISGPAAARLASGLELTAPDKIDVLVRTSVQPADGMRKRRIAPDPRWVQQLYGGLAVTTPELALLDSLRWLSPADAWEVSAWVAAARTRYLPTMRAMLRAQPKRRGNAQAAELLANCESGIASVGEKRAHKVLRAAGITGWHANQRIYDRAGRIVAVGDIVFEAEQVVVEIDGARFHGVRQLQRDSNRNNALVQLGWQVLHFTWDDLTRRPDYVIATLRSVLAARRNRRPLGSEAHASGIPGR